jgi:capsular exopolysaccharide synthesis family protein
VRVLAFKSRLTPKALDRKKNLLAYYTPDSPIAEQYRSIKTNIYFTCSSQNIRSLLITSPSDGEGKSTTAVNLAVSMAQKSERVLLIDANLRRPTAQLTFKIPNAIGLTSILNGMASFDEAIHKTEIGHLDIIPSGPIPFFPTETLASESMEQLLTKTLELYDYVLIDSASLLELADSKILANQCDGVVLVMNPGKTKLEKAVEARRVLELANSQIVGVILNEI